MQVNWPSDMSDTFHKKIITASHDTAEQALFQDKALADLLDAYPRDQMGIYTFPDHTSGRVKALHGRAPELSGADLLRAVKTQKIWLNLRAVNHVIPEYETYSETFFKQMEDATGERTFKRDVGLLISSPNIHVHYHLDIPLVCLVQLRGTKTLHVYPAKAPFATEDQIEAVALRERDEEIHFEHSFDAHVTDIHLTPGMAVTWPQNAPHRVQNSDCMNVSLSCEFMTAKALVRANAIYANGVLRRKLGRTPRLPEHFGVAQMTKAALARVIKLYKRPPAQSPTPISFELSKETLAPMALPTYQAKEATLEPGT